MARTCTAAGAHFDETTQTNVLVGNEGTSHPLRNLQDLSSCYSAHNFTVYFQGECNSESWVERMGLKMSEGNSLYGNSACLNSPIQEIALLLGVDDEGVEEKIDEMCKAAIDDFDTNPGTSMSWDQVTRKGEMFDKNYYDGGSYWNEGE